MNKKILETAEKIRSMKVQGAVSIALAAANAMEIMIEESTAESKEIFIKELEDAGEVLIHARPTAVALPNAVNAFIAKVKLVDADVEKLKKESLYIGKKLVKEVTEGVELIGKYSAELIKSGDVVLIHCHSSTVMAGLKEAWRQKKDFSVICTESRPWHQGYLSAKELSDFGIPTTLIIDSAVMSVMPQVSKVFVGADTITKDFKLINKIGTSQIALIAKKFGRPFYVATELLKVDKTRAADEVTIEERTASEIVDPGKLPKVVIKNPVFDVTDEEYITKLVTDRGVLGMREVVS